MGLYRSGCSFYLEGKNLESALYIVATPIGNLNDITLRAIETLKGVDCIAAEDTRHTKRLLDALVISAKMVSLHEHNEFERAASVLDKVVQGGSVALVSDAGTPLISDPGSILVRMARERGVKVVPIPGPSALIAGLSVSGADCRRFIFEGFLPVKTKARKDCLKRFERENRTVVFYESPHRIVDTLSDLVDLYPDRGLVLARELTKTFETVYRSTVADVQKFVLSDSNQQRGEFVIMLEGVEHELSAEDFEFAKTLMVELVDELPPKKAAAIVARVTSFKKNELYDMALALKKKV